MYTEEVVDLVEDLEQYYEAAGFADFHDRILKNMTDEKIRAYHEKTFKKLDPEELGIRL